MMTNHYNFYGIFLSEINCIDEYIKEQEPCLYDFAKKELEKARDCKDNHFIDIFNLLNVFGYFTEADNQQEIIKKPYDFIKHNKHNISDFLFKKTGLQFKFTFETPRWMEYYLGNVCSVFIGRYVKPNLNCDEVKVLVSLLFCKKDNFQYYQVCEEEEDFEWDFEGDEHQYSDDEVEKYED